MKTESQVSRNFKITLAYRKSEVQGIQVFVGIS
jgi:hypothetical protein